MVRVGFIGTESKHFTYFGNILNNRGIDSYRLVGVFSPDEGEETARNKSADIDCDYFTTAEELINASDLVMVITRSAHSHENYGKMALEKGRNVFLDKPAATSATALKSMYNLAERKNLSLFGGSSLVWLEQFQDIKSSLKDESEVIIRYFGEADSIYDGFRFYGSHFAQVVIAMFGSDYRNVKAQFLGSDANIQIDYPARKVILQMSPVFKDKPMEFLSAQGTVHLREEDCYKSILMASERLSDSQKLDYADVLIDTVALTERIIKEANK